MPTVIGINQVPANIPRPTFWDYYGQFGGTAGRQVTDALLAVMTGGAYGGVQTVPSPSNPGQLTFPSGATTPTSPQELFQLQAMGGVPSRQGDIIPFGNPATGGVQYTTPTRFGRLPNSQNPVLQSQAAYRDELTRQARAAAAPPAPAAPPPLPPQPSDGGSPFTSTSSVVNTLWDRAQKGDAKSMDAIRLLALEKNDPEAIALLYSQGEL